MNRFINWLLGGLAVGVAVRALGPRRQAATTATGVGVPAAPPPTDNSLAVAADERWYNHERVQTARSFTAELAGEL